MNSSHSNVDLTRTIPCSSLVNRHEEACIRRSCWVLNTLSIGVVGYSLVHFTVLNDSTGLVLREVGGIQLNLEAVGLLVLDPHRRQAVDLSHSSHFNELHVVSILVDIVKLTSAEDICLKVDSRALFVGDANHLEGLGVLSVVVMNDMLITEIKESISSCT